MADSGFDQWPAPAEPAARVTLHFGEAEDKKTIANLSAGSRQAGTMFVAADEACMLERVTEIEGCEWGDHARFDLADFLDLDDPEGEADLEGLAVDEGWLWLLGSHARTRVKPEKAPGGVISLDELANLKDTRPRCLLARVPLAESAGGVLTPVREDGDRRAGMLKQGKHGNELGRMLRGDPLLKPFTRVPAKEGGIDVEGIAVCGSRIALGMRGPVIAGFALLLELGIGFKKSGQLKLTDTPIKRLLDLEGLGIRDLKRCGDDLLILAGPTTGLDGPCAIYRWRDWVCDPPQDPEEVRLHRPDRIVELPFGRGCDHPEGLALWPEHGGVERLLVIYDSPAPARLDRRGRTIVADLFDLPG